MYHYNYTGLVQEKRNEMEKKYHDAWKFADLKQPSLLIKTIQKFSFSRKSKSVAQHNNCECICGC